MLQGVVQRVAYRSPDSDYTVLLLSPERGSGPKDAFGGPREGPVGAVGAAEGVAEGLRLRLHGHWRRHPRHGERFEFEWFEPLPPLDREGLLRYLASSAFRGIGKTLAARIVDRLGLGALARIRAEPEALEGIPGLSRKVRESLVATISSELGGQELVAFLLGAGLGPHQASLVAKKCGADAEQRIRANPYLIARGIPGVGFQAADRIARGLGLAEDASERSCAAILHVLNGASSDGHTMLLVPDLIGGVERLLSRSYPLEACDADLQTLAREAEIVVEETGTPDEPQRAVYLSMLHTCESRLAENLQALIESGPVRPLAEEAQVSAAEREAGLALHSEQRSAVAGLLRIPVGLLTGGPGVGKTTIVRLLVELAESAGARVLLASPTGRAAKRLAEATGREACTLHRLLGFEPATRRFARDSRDPLEADLVVVDEISMLDVILAHHLLKALQPPTRLILVGDPDQLPSVAPGNVLADLLASERIPVFRLSHVFRQEARSLIVRNAHRILAGRLPELPERGAPPRDFYFFAAEGDATAARLLVDVVTRRIPERFGLSWIDDVQVIAPMYRGDCGVDNLNERLRAALGREGRQIRWAGQVWRVGDRVIQTRNDYERQVFNGDMGRICAIAADGQSLSVRFPEGEQGYTRGTLDQLRPAFAITVHRSQGGEYPAVVLPLVPSHRIMLQRNLLYTAVTRARRLVVLVGSRDALRMAIENTQQQERCSGLAQRLAEESAGR